MKINLIPEQSLLDFEKQFGIEIEVNERRNRELPHFYASASNVEATDGVILEGLYGNGNTPDEALADLARVWSYKLLVKNAYHKNKRKEISAPKLIYIPMASSKQDAPK